MTRTAISPRLAIRIFFSTSANVGGVTGSGGIARDDPDATRAWTVSEVVETGSTNADLVASVVAGIVDDRTALRADHQTAGRGRLDRRWTAPPGSNLLVSICLLDPPDPPTLVTQRLGVAAVRAVVDSAPALAGRVGLKWPNDVLLDGRKLAGILAERTRTGAVVAGMGLNVGWAPQGAACLRDAAPASVPTPRELLTVVLDHFDGLDWNTSADAYRSVLSTLGEEVRVELPGDRHVFGRAVDVDPAGRIVVERHDGTVDVFDVGDVVHLRRR